MPTMDYSCLKGKIVECGLTQKTLAARIGISEGQLCQKLSGRFAFKQSEILAICKVLDIDMKLIADYFFSPLS